MNHPLRRSARMTVLATCLYAGLTALAAGAAQPEAPVSTTSAPPVVAASAAAPATHGNHVVAIVNGKSISAQEYETLFAATIRERFYHGKIPEGETEKVRKEALDQLIERVLMEQEAEKRGLKPDQAKLEAAVASYEARYGGSAMWQQQRERLLPDLRAQLSRMDVVEQMEYSLRKVSERTAEEVRAYYDQHPENFTEPEKLHLSTILLRVDPSAPKIIWDKAREEAQGIYKRIKAGADFAELAKLHSNDDSSIRGGDLGYLHRGMLPEALQAQVDSFKQGVVAEPITLLEGIALFRLDGRVPPKLRDFKDVEQRAGELCQRDRETRARGVAIARLRKDAKIEILAPINGSENSQLSKPAN